MRVAEEIQKMKFIGLLVCVFAARAPFDALFRKQKSLDQFRFAYGVRPEIPRKLEPNIKVVSPGKMIEFDVRSNEPQRNVSQLITALQVASGFLENAISFTYPIKVNLTHGSYCNEGSICNGESTLGITN